jgi:hypothetical protein
LARGKRVNPLFWQRINATQRTAHGIVAIVRQTGSGDFHLARAAEMSLKIVSNQCWQFHLKTREQQQHQE